MSKLRYLSAVINESDTRNSFLLLEGARIFFRKGSLRFLFFFFFMGVED